MIERYQAIVKVEAYLNELNPKLDEEVPIYKNRVKRKIVQFFNYMKYKKKLSLFRRIEITKYIQNDSQCKDYLVIKATSIKETKDFWLIPYNSFKLFEDYDIQHGYIGLGPIVVHKKSGRLFKTYTSMLDVLVKMKEGEKVDLETLKDCEIDMKIN